MYGLDNVTGWEPCDLHDLIANGPGVRVVLLQVRIL